MFVLLYKFSMKLQLFILALSVIFGGGSKIYGQEVKYLAPEIQVTYGNNTHTGRDYLMHTVIDNENNIILAGLTEEDFSFTDVYVSKHDKEMNLLWKKRISFDTPISYDYPLKVLVGKKNDIYIVSKSLALIHEANLEVVKFDASGELLWKYESTRPFETSTLDLSSPNFYLNDSDEVLYFLGTTDQELGSYGAAGKISSDGKLIEERKVSDLKYGDNYQYYFKSVYKDGNIRAICMKQIDDYPYNEFYQYIWNFNDSSLEKINIPHEETSLFSSYFIEPSSTVRIDENNNIYIVEPGNYRDEANFTLPNYYISKISAESEWVYSIQPDKNWDKIILDWGLYDNKLIIVGNRRPTTSINLEDMELYRETYNSHGQLISIELDNSIIGNIANIVNDQVSVFSHEMELILYNESFDKLMKYNFIDEALPLFTADRTIILDDNLFVSGTTFAKKFEGSDYNSDQNIILMKGLDSGNKLYSYSGEGTSKFYSNSLWTNEQGNYVATGMSHLGPDNLNIGGSRSKKTARKLTYSKSFELLSDEILENLPDYKVEFNKFIDPDGNQYEYRITENRKAIEFYYNTEFKWKRDFEFSSHLGEIGFSNMIDMDGNFITSSYNYYSSRLHRLSPENEYKHTENLGIIQNLLILENGWVFIYDSDRMISVFSNNLEFIKKNENDQIYDYAFLRTKNNKVLFQARQTYHIKIFNQFAEEINELELEATLNSENAIFEPNGDLITWHSIGSSIPLEHGYLWLRGSLNRYKGFVDKYLPKDADGDDDSDSVLNSIDQCPNTPTNSEVNETGCLKHALSNDNFVIITKGETCLGKNNGGLIITAKEIHNYTAAISADNYNQQVDFSRSIQMDNIPSGIYRICISSDFTPGEEQCFQFRIVEGYLLSGTTEKITENLIKIRMEKGTAPFEVKINDQFSKNSNNSNFDINVFPGDKIQVYSSKECEGVYEYKIPIRSVILYPNPVGSELHLIFSKQPTSIKEKVVIEIFNALGQNILVKEYQIKGSEIKVKVENFSPGNYFIKINGIPNETLKFIKR